jgi:hypothetical protein
MCADGRMAGGARLRAPPGGTARGDRPPGTRLPVRAPRPVRGSDGGTDLHMRILSACTRLDQRQEPSRMKSTVSLLKKISRSTPASLGSQPLSSVFDVPVESLRPSDSPRIELVNMDHVRVLRVTEQDFPPVLVHRDTMQVIDGMHRLEVAKQEGRSHIEARFFDGSAEEAFILAVKSNSLHGLPLTLEERRAAAVRVLESHPQMSDRSIGVLVGLAAKTVSSLRDCSSAENPQLNARVGRDGRARPVDAAAGRRRAVQIIESQPDASLRQIAAEAGISLGTASDVRKRFREGKPVLLEGGRRGRVVEKEGAGGGGQPPQVHLRAIFEKLRQDPSLRYSDSGRSLLRWLGTKVLGDSMTEEWEESALIGSPHNRTLMVKFARVSAQMWLDLADRLESDARKSM